MGDVISGSSSRSRSERQVVGIMIHMYCAGNRHSANPLCPECEELMAYASKRVTDCPFGEHKPTCAKCTVHCYDGPHRESIRAVMRYSGPRMAFRHPFLAGRHFIDGRKRPVRREARHTKK